MKRFIANSLVGGLHQISVVACATRNKQALKILLAAGILTSFVATASTSSGSGMSQTGGSGKSIIQNSIAPIYLTGDYYLAPWGSDANVSKNPPCSLEQPCQTITGIQSLLAPGKVVLLRGGFYFLSAPVSPTASGTSASPIVYAAYPDETPIITGAQPLTGWTDASGPSDCDYPDQTVPNCWKTTIPTGFTNFEYLVYVPAGWPASNVACTMTRRSQSTSTTTYLRNTCVSCTNQVLVNTSDVSLLTSGSHNLHDIKYYNFPDFNVDALRVESVMTVGDTTTLTFTGPPSSGGFPPGARYLIANSLEYFRSNATPGTFYIDCGTPCIDKTGGIIGGATIYYIAKNGENPPVDLILAPQQGHILVDGPTNSSIADYITIEGLVFVGDNYVPLGGYVSEEGQPAATAALSFVNTEGVIIDSAIIAHTSGWGLEFTNPACTIYPNCPTITKASKDNQLTNSALYDIGTSALRLGRMPPNKNSDQGNSSLYATQNTRVENNILTSTGRMYPGAADGCIWIGSSWGNLIQYNECSDSYGGGMAIGPKAGYTDDYTYGNTVQYNKFHDLGEGVITDFGCVHFANWGGVDKTGPGTGNTFQNNICHDMTDAVADNGQGAVGIYIDGRSQCNTVRNNLVFRSSGSLYFHNTPKVQAQCSNTCLDTGGGGSENHGCNNLVSNNIFAYSYLNSNNWGGAIKRGGPPPPDGQGGDNFLSFVFKHNIVLWDSVNGPQWLKNGTGFWTCVENDPVFPTPCTQYFGFYSNGYWSPRLAAPTFATTGTGTAPPTTFWSLQAWQAGNVNGNPAEDLGKDGFGNSVFQDPRFNGPGYPWDDYHFSDSPPPIGFDTSSFSATYTAGRNKPVIFPPATAPGFPLQLLSPLQF